jgi:hypothetical protein
MPGVHRVASLLKRWLLEQAILADPITYRSLIANPHPGRPRATLPKRSPPSLAVERPWRNPT